MKGDSTKKVFALIDGKSVFYRGYYAMPNLSTKGGIPTGGVYGFASLALELLRQIQPDYVAVAWDKPHTNIRKRLEIYDQYKANRKPAPPDFYEQIPILHELLAAFGWPLYELDDYEADDIMGTLSNQANARGIHTIMISSDLDMLQLIDSDTEMYALKKGLANLEKFDPKSFSEKYGIRVDQFLDLKSLKGDASDNIPGVAGIGEKTAISLLQNFETLDGIYNNLTSEKIKQPLREKLISGKDFAFMSRNLAKIWCDAPLELDLKAVDVKNLDAAKLREELTKLEFTSLLRKLPEYMRGNSENIFQNSAQNIDEIHEAKIEDLNENTQEILKKSKILVVEIGEKDDWESRGNLPKNVEDDSLEDRGKKMRNSSRKITRDQSNLFDKLDEIEHPPEKFLLISPSKNIAYKTDFKTANEILTGKKIVAHDARVLAEEFLNHKIEPNFLVEFDTRLAAFLLNSSRKSPSLADAVSWTNVDEDGELSAMKNGEKIAAIWRLFGEQKNEISSFEKMESLARNVDFPLQIVIAKIENRGVLLDTEILKIMSENLAVNIREIEQKIWAMVGYEFNISSSPQLSDALFKKLQLPTAGIKKSVRGYFSTGQKELDKLRGTHEIIEEIEKIRELLKLKNTYIDALPLMVDSQNRLHTTLRQDVTATGRLSSSNPNLQNIPTRTKLGREIRRAFTAGEGKVLVNADYSQFELRLAAALSRDEKLIQNFANSHIDIHTKTAAEAFSVAPEDVTPAQRRSAKVINFGVLYGMSPHGLAAATGMNFAEAKHFIDKYFELRKPIREFLDSTIKKAETEGFVETLFGRRRPTPDVKAANFAMREAAKRAAANMPIQGTEADLMKMAMLKIEREIPLASQLMQVHDSILAECMPVDAESVGAKMREIMENIYPNLGVKLEVEIKVGRTWAEI